jgi:hypothetical protein
MLPDVFTTPLIDHPALSTKLSILEAISARPKRRIRIVARALRRIDWGEQV